MKINLILFLVISLVSLKSKAQYIPLVEEDKYWIYISNWSNDFPNATSGYLIHFEGDTLIDNQSYKKVIRQGLAGSHPCPPHEQPCFQLDRPYKTISKGIYGFIREEVDSQKVYFLPIFDNFCKLEEFLLFDFSKMQNDTLNDCLKSAIGKNEFNEFGIVDSVTTTELFGKQRKTLNTNGLVTYIGLPYEGNVKIAEGLGFDKYGLFHRFNNLDGLADFCEGNCEILSSSKRKEVDVSIKIFPNPTSSFLNIESEFGIERLSLFDIYGKRYIQKFEQKSINVSALPSGFYFLEIETSQNTHRIFKVSKL